MARSSGSVLRDVFVLANPCVEDEAEVISFEFTVMDHGVWIKPRFSCKEYEEANPGKLKPIQEAREVWKSLTKRGFVRKK